MPLQESEFRLVEVLPARIHEIRCRISNESLLDLPPYIAISYAWGGVRDTAILQLEEGEVPVAVSLR